jgi:hypothetical protein
MKTKTSAEFTARADTLIALGPVRGQYWSMPVAGEVDQVLNAGIITPKQFHGVVSRRDICKARMTAYPKLHWHCGDSLETEDDPGPRPRGGLSQIAVARLADFLDVMHNHPDFHPGLVNADLLANVDQTAQIVAQLLYLVLPHNAKLVVTFVMACRSYRTTPEHVIDRLLEQQLFRYAVHQGWSHGDRCYLYAGTHSTVKGTFVFQRRRTHQASKDPS